MWKSMLAGALVAVLLVAVVAGLAVAHVGPFAGSASSGAPAPTVLALVAPGADGVLAPAVIDLYTPSSGGWSVKSILPTTPVAVPGTSGSTLADAYSFGGGDGLAQALASQTGGLTPHWVLVDSGTLARIAGSFSLNLPSDIEVFDGSQLYSFPQGMTSVPATAVPQLLQGATQLPASDAQAVRDGLGDALASALSSAGPVALASVRSDLGDNSIADWLASIRAARRTGGP
jgi:hypothetical protein